ncbi:MAG: dehydrogenase E1 component subunit alpha/beta [Planctomycetia bacterium]
MNASDMLAGFAAELRTALLIRRTEQKLLALFAEGKLFGTVHTCIGQEFSAVAVGRSLAPHDTVFSTHRGHGHFLATGGTVGELVAEVMGKETGICKGRGGSQHLQKGRYFSNGIQGGIVPVTAGLAMAHKLRGDGGIATVFIGDGTLGEGGLYETLNIASKWELPLLVVCENNLYAQSTSQTETLAGDICARAAAFGIATRRHDTYDWQELFTGLKDSIDEVRRTSRPVFHRVDTFRLMAHSKGDDNRPADYVQEHWDRDPLAILERSLADDPRWQAIQREVDDEVARAAEAAERAAFGTVEPPRSADLSVAWRPLEFAEERTVRSVQRGLDAALAADDRVILIGEDIESPYGGAFKCTDQLSARHPGRVRNTPISELAIVGIGNGLALGGFRPIVEIMFGDFITLALDQWVNHAAKFAFMFADKVTVPLVVRTPMGGKRGYGATHSQSLERHVVGVPGTRVLCLHHRYPAANLYDAIGSGLDTPTFVIENKVLYGKTVSSAVPAGYSLSVTDDRFPTVRLAPPDAPQLTVVALGGIGADTEEALARLFLEHEATADLFLPTQLYPFNIGCLADSLRATGRLLVVEEGQGFASVGAEIVARASEMLGSSLRLVKRVAAVETPIPAARPLEQACLPGVERILAAAASLCR